MKEGKTAAYKNKNAELRARAEKLGKKIYKTKVKQKLPNNRGYYVYETESFYDPEIKQNRTFSRKLVGKLPPGETDVSKMLPTDKKYVSKKVDAGEVLKSAGVVVDPRRQACVQYPLDVVLLVIVLAVMMGHPSCYAIAEFWAAQMENLKKLISGFPSQAISHDTIRRIIKILGGQAGIDFVKKLTEPLLAELSQKLIALDGQAVRAAGELGTASRYTFNVFSCDEELCLRQVLIGAKENEITRAVEAVEDLPLEGAIVTCDALNTQKKLAQCLVGKGADYCFALKENHKTFYSLVTIVFKSKEASEKAVVLETNDKGHGRVEKRVYRVLPASSYPELKDCVSEWAGLEDGCIVETTTDRYNAKSKEKTVETRYFITTLHFDTEYIGRAVARAIRGHWGIENKLHWSLDVVFNQDRTQCKNADFINGKTSVNKIAYNIMSRIQRMQEEKTGKPALSKPALKAKSTDVEWTLGTMISLFGGAQKGGENSSN